MEKTKEVLIVEDSDFQALALKRVLTENGYSASIAKNGSEGLLLARSLMPALIISDILMPVMDGFQMCAEIKRDESLKRIPVMLLTQVTEPEDVIKGLASGADNYITTPYSAPYLLSKVKSLTSGQRPVRNDPENKRIELEFNGQIYGITSGREQTFNFLLSTYENVVRKNSELIRAQEELERLNNGLGDMVRSRTDELAKELSDRRSAEKALMESEKRLTAVVESAPDAIIGLRPPGVIYMWNPKAAEMFGFSASEAMGKDMHELIVPEEYRQKARDGLKNFFLTGQGNVVGKTIELNALRADGAVFPVELSVSVIKVEDEWHSLGIIRDITARRRFEEELKKTIDETDRMNRLMVGRELKMEELRNTIRGLEQRIIELQGPRHGM
ncbi:MAG: PAS domain S-box protein [Deltaproteobacteria bacterium]